MATSTPNLWDRLEAELAEFDRIQASSPEPTFNPRLNKVVCVCTVRTFIILGVFLLLLVLSIIICILFA